MSGRLLVTGATGYLGRSLCAVAVAAGWDVTAAGSADGDIRDRRAVDALVRGAAPDVVIHTAYAKDVPTARAVIVDGTANVANATRAVGARLVHMSSDVVFDGSAGRPYREPDGPSPTNDYGRAKSTAEHLVRTLDPAALVVRTSLIYGGPDGPTSGHEDLAHDPTAVFFEDEVRCPVQVHDLATALVELAGSDVAGILHVAGPEAVSRHQFAELITGRPVRHAPAPAGRPLDCRLDTAHAQASLATVLRGVSEVYAR
jgi:dTDP-4-dehydrorhamnose reductase